MINNLGRIVTIIARAEAREQDYHADVSAWGAPSECHGAVSKGEAARMRQARKQAEAEARRPWRVIVQEAKRRGIEFHAHNRHYARAVGQLCAFPF